MPGDEENLSDEAIWETLPVRIYINFFVEKIGISCSVFFF